LAAAALSCSAGGPTRGAAYAGVSDAHSKYDWDNIFPDATDWSHGDRELVCVAFHPTPSTPGGTPISGSIKGSRR